MQLLKNTQKYRRTPKGVLTNMYNHMKSRHEVKFDLKFFHKLYLTDKNYLSLFKKWEKSGYKKQLKPSLDRIDNKKCYELSNIQMMTWAQNRFKQSSVDGKKGRKPAVLQLLGNNIIKRFDSQRHVVKELGISQGNLSSVLNGKRESVNGFKFIYENQELLEAAQ